MTMRTNCILLLVILLGAFPLNRVHADESGSIILYTPYTKISVTPGASIDYSIDLINNTDRVTNANLSVSGLPGSWKHEIKSGGWTLSQLSVLSKEKKTFNLKVEVPLKVNKGSYHFTVFAGETKLPLEVVVAQKGTYQTEFTTDQPNMQGNSKSTFTFNATLKNQTADQQLYALMANAPRGWSVVFKPNYKQATSAQVEANSSQNVSIEIVPPANVEAGNYKIPVRAATGTTSADLELEVVVTGSYEMELSTPRGLLSTEITAGDVKRIELVVRNTGSSLLKDIQLSDTSETTPPARERGFLGLPICRYFPRCADRTERNDVHGASARQPAYLLPACSMYGRGVYPTGRYRPANAAIPHRAVQRLQILYAVPLWAGYSSHPAALQPLHQRGQRAAEQPRRELPRGTPRLPDRL